MDILLEDRRRIALVVEYDGTNYSGYQWQPRSLTIQYEIESAINRFTGETIRVRGASRTDSGAHAKGQTVDFLTYSRHPADKFVRALNFFLPRDIRIRSSTEVDPTFNSRKRATGRVYRYTIVNGDQPSALLRDFSFWIRNHLDVDKMNIGASHLIGTHDFANLALKVDNERNTIRKIYRWDIWRERELVIIECKGNAFLPHQIRSTNGLLVEIGLSKKSPSVIKDVIDGRIMTRKNWPVLPARGLCLMEVEYQDISKTGKLAV